MKTMTPDEYVKELASIKNKKIPLAARETLKKSALLTQKYAKDNVKRGMINRSQHALRSITIDFKKNLYGGQYLVGSSLEYMAKQEKGFISRDPIPTEAAAGQTVGTRPRLRPILRRFYLSNMRIKYHRPGANRRQRNAIAIKDSRRFALLELSRNRKGLFDVSRGGRPVMLYDVSRKPYTTRPARWLAKAQIKASKKIQSTAHEQLVEIIG